MNPYFPMEMKISTPQMSAERGVKLLVFILILIFGSIVIYPLFIREYYSLCVFIGILVFLTAIIITASIRIATEWEKIPVFRFGRYISMRGPGIFFIIPIIDTTPFRIDMRIITYDVPKQKTLTSDNIPVTVDAVVYYKVIDPKSAVLDIEDFAKGTQLGATTILRDIIGKTSFDSLLGEREKIGQIIQEHLDKLTKDWGIKVTNVEIKDVIIPETLEDAIAREPAAEREKRARLKLAEAEKLAAKTIYDAAQIYEEDPIALQLRSMNMLYEMCMEGKGTIIFVPTETHLGMPQPTGVYGIVDKLKTSLEKQLQKKSKEIEELQNKKEEK